MPRSSRSRFMSAPGAAMWGFLKFPKWILTGNKAARKPFEEGRGRRPPQGHGDRPLFGGGPLSPREGGRPPGTGVGVRPVADARSRIGRLKLPRALEEAGRLDVPGIGGRAAPGSRREGRRAGLEGPGTPPDLGGVR